MDISFVSVRKIRFEMHLGTILGFLVCLCTSAAHAGLEIGAPFIQNFIPKEYGAHAQVWAIAEDKHGIMYFSTTGGEIIEFDGTSWRVIETPRKSPIRSLTVGPFGRVYYGGTGEFGYLDVSSAGNLRCVPLDGNLPGEHSSFKDVWKIISTSHGVYFISTERTFRWHDNRMYILPVGSITATNIGEKIYLYSESYKGLALIDNGSVSELSDSVLDDETYGKVRVLFPLPNRDEILLFSSKRGLLVYSVPQGGLAKGGVPRIRELSNQANDYFIHNKVYKAIPLDEERTAFATLDGGIVILNRLFELVRVINDNRGLLTKTVFCVHQDRFKNLWTAMNGGIAYILLSSPLTYFGTKSGVTSLVTSVFRHQNSIYAGTFGMGPLRLQDYAINLDNDLHELISPQGDVKGYAWSFLKVNNTLLVASESVRKIEGEKISDIENTPLGFCLHLSRQLKGRVYLGIAAPGGGGLGIIEYQTRGDTDRLDTVFDYKGKVKGIDEIIHGIAEDTNGNIWLSTQQSGIIRVRPTSAKLDDFEVERYDESHGLPSMNWNSVYVNQEQIMVATSNGVYQYIPPQADSRKGNRFVPIEEINKVINSAKVTNIRAYGKNKWLLNPLDLNGILTRNADNTYTIENRPFRAVDVNEFAVPYIDSDGVVWTGTLTELLRYDPKTKKDYSISYETLIRSVKKGSGKVLYGGAYRDPTFKSGNEYKRMSVSQTTTRVPTLKYEENGLTFEYSALFYEHMDRTAYKYRLVGFDRDWSDWSKKTLKEYTNIPEGTYTFKVKAKNIYGTESSVASYRFRILAPWYRTVWAYAGYVIGFFLLVFVGVQFNSRRLLAAKRRLEKIVDQRTLEVVKQRDELAAQKKQIEEAQKLIVKLEKETTERQMAGGFAHEIRNALTGANMMLNRIIRFTPAGQSMGEVNNQTLLELFKILKNNLKKDTLQEVAPKIKDINKTEKQIDDLINKAHASVTRSLAVTDQILTYSQVGQETSGTDEVPLDELFDEIQNEQHELLEERGIKLQFVGEPGLRIYGNKIHFYIILTNIILNARDALVQRKDREDLPKSIEVKTRFLENDVVFEILDNGVGILAKDLERIFDPFFTTNPERGTGLGLGMVKKYIEIYHGDIKYESTVNEGTKVIISFPKEVVRAERD